MCSISTLYLSLSLLIIYLIIKNSKHVSNQMMILEFFFLPYLRNLSLRNLNDFDAVTANSKLKTSTWNITVPI